jgi:hypothetical protein
MGTTVAIRECAVARVGLIWTRPSPQRKMTSLARRVNRAVTAAVIENTLARAF